MNDKVDVKEDIKEDVDTVVDEPEHTQVELDAMEHGWVPEGVEGKPNLSAEEFMGRQKLYNDLSSVKRQLRQQHDVIEQLKTTAKLAREQEREKVLNELKKAKKTALENENYDAVVEVDDKIAEVKATAAHEAATATTEVDTEFESWVSENGWYNQDADLKDEADYVGVTYFQKHPGMTKSEVYNYVTETMKKRHPDKFEGSSPRVSKSAPVEGSRRNGKPSSKKHSAKDLPDEARDIMRNLVKQKVVTEEEYLEQFFG